MLIVTSSSSSSSFFFFFGGGGGPHWTCSKRVDFQVIYYGQMNSNPSHKRGNPQVLKIIEYIANLMEFKITFLELILDSPPNSTSILLT